MVRGAKGRELLESGDLDKGLVWAGQSQGLVHDIPTVAELIGRMIRDATALMGRLAGTMH